MLNARGRLCRVHNVLRSVYGDELMLLNARGRLCRVHSLVGEFVPAKYACSTPGGVFVGFTLNNTLLPSQLSAAQRPGASLSGSLDLVWLEGATSRCSTPGGVFVGFTRTWFSDPKCVVAAQRPGASLSGSPPRRRRQRRGRDLLNARGRLCRVHELSRRDRDEGVACSTPGGVFVGFTHCRVRPVAILT